MIKYIAATITYIALYAAAIILIIRNKKPNSLNGKYWKHIYAIEKGIIVFKLIWDTSWKPTAIVRDKGAEQNWNEGSEWKIIGCFDTVNIEIWQIIMWIKGSFISILCYLSSFDLQYWVLDSSKTEFTHVLIYIKIIFTWFYVMEYLIYVYVT